MTEVPKRGTRNGLRLTRYRPMQGVTVVERAMGISRVGSLTQVLGARSLGKYLQGREERGWRTS